MSESLAKLKTMFENDINTAMDVSVPEPDYQSRDIVSLLDTLTPEEQEEFNNFCDDLVVTKYPEAMEDFGPAMRHMVECYIKDMVAVETGSERVSDADRKAAVFAVEEDDVPYMRAVCQSEAVEAVIRVRVREEKKKQSIAA
jgi:hypothetical protein